MSETPPEKPRHPLERDQSNGSSPDPSRRHPLEDQPQRRPESEPGQKRQVRVNIAFEGLPQRATLTYWLIGINVAIFVVGFLFPDINNQLLLFGWNDPASILEGGQYYRLFTAMFLHGSPAHIFFNSYALYIIGVNVERLFGHTRYLILYMLGGLTGSVLSIMFGDYAIPSIGASGAVFAIWGAEAIHLYTHREMYQQVVRQRLQSTLLFMGINLVLGFLPGSRIDNWGHIGGLIGGAILAWLIGPQFKPTADHENQRVLFKDTNPLNEKYNLLIFYISGLIVLLIIATLFVPPR